MSDSEIAAPAGRGMAIRGPQDFVAGLAVLALAGFAWWALSRVPATSFQSISPTVFPKLCASVLGLCGIALAARGLLRDGPGLEAWPLRAMAMVTLAAVAFGVLTGLVGYLVAGGVAVVLAGLASSQSRPRELLALAAGLVLFSYLLFTVGLKLSLPVFRFPGLVG